MRVLLDHCVDIHFAKLLIGHEVQHTKEMGWGNLSNGKLLAAAEEEGFLVLITVDKNVRHQQTMAKKGISLITLNPRFVDYDFIAPMAFKVIVTLNAGIQPGSEIVIDP